MMEKHGGLNRVPGEVVRLQSGSERGVALVLVLVLTTIGLIVMTTVLYVLTMGTQMSGSEKRYRTAHEAALGGVEIVRKVIADQSAGTIAGVTIVYPSAVAFSSKLTGASVNYDVVIDPDQPATYDMYVELGNPSYRVYAKMIQLVKGNSMKGYQTLRVHKGVISSDKIVRGEANFTYYTFTILAQKKDNPRERVRMDVVHTF